MPLVPVRLRRTEEVAELLDLSGIRPEEPFLSQTLARAEDELGRQRVRMPLREYLDAAPSSAPQALIFHVGRCGSSVLVNMLQALPDGLVVSESPFVNGSIRRWVERAKTDGEEARDVMVRAIAAASQRWNDERTRVLKTASWNLVAGFELMRAFPESRAVFLCRDAEDVVASNLRRPPAWSRLTAEDPALIRTLFPSLRDRDPLPTGAELYAHAWRSEVERADFLPREQTLHVDYGDFTADLAGWLERILTHLRIEASDQQRDAMLETARFDAKDPGRPFEPSRGPLPEDDAELVRAITGPAERRRLFDRLVLAHVAPAVAPFGFDDWQLNPSPGAPRRSILFHADPASFQARRPHLMADYGEKDPTCIDLWIHLDEATGLLDVDVEGANVTGWLKRTASDLLDRVRSPRLGESVPALAEGLRLLLATEAERYRP